MVTKKTLLLIILILLVVFIAQNTQVVTVRFLLWEKAVSLVLLIPLLTIIGMAIGFILDWRMNKKHAKKKNKDTTIQPLDSKDSLK